MRVPTLLAVLALAAGCGTSSSAKTFLHPEYAARRPAMLAMRIEGPEAVAGDVAEAVKAALIARNYSVQIPGEPPGPGMGLVKVVFETRDSKLTAVLTIFDPERNTLFRSEGAAKTPEKLAEVLLRMLPEK